MNKYWCNENFGICYPLLKEVDITRPITEQKNYNNEYGRYWTKPVLRINGKDYILCSQWFRGFQPKLDKWVESQLSVPIPIVKRDKTRCVEYDFKKDVCMCSYAGNFMMQCEGINGCTHYKEQMPVYIIPKVMSKQGKCPCCGTNLKTEFLIVTYKGEKSGTHKLISSRCENCEQSYVSGSIFATYTKNKNLEDLDVRFVPITQLKK